MAEESDFQLQNSLQAIEYGKECVRSGILINGGAAVALVGFLGGEKTIANMQAIQDSLVAFCVGVIAAFLAAMIGYVAQTRFAVHNSRVASGVPSTTKSAVLFSVIGVASITWSIGEFCYGIYTAGQALFPTTP